MLPPTKPGKPVLQPPTSSAKSDSSDTTLFGDNHPEGSGGVRLADAEYPSPPSQLPRNYRKILPDGTLGPLLNPGLSYYPVVNSVIKDSEDDSYVSNSAESEEADSDSEDEDSDLEDEDSDEETDEEEAKTTAVGEHQTDLSSDEESTSSRGSSYDSDDVFSPGSPSSVKAEHLSEFARRLSLSAARARTEGPVTTPANGARSAIRPSRGVALNNDFSTEVARHLSPAKTISERRLARRAIKFGDDVAHAARTPLTINTQLGVPARHQTDEIDAQGLYPPTACVFVANLPQPENELALEAAVTRVFCAYGTVFVKIRRDGNDMPFAFCQYTKDEDAVRAMQHGKGIMILGRPCRTEMVKGNRTFVIWKRNRTDISVDEAREIMEHYGALAKCEQLDEKACNAMKLPQAVVVEFTKFDPAREASMIARQNLGYDVEAYDTKMRTHVTRASEDEAFLKQYEADRRSIYVAGLPADVEEDEVARYFERVGEVVHVEIYRRRSMDGATLRAFAFVEFVRLDIPDIAIAKLDNTKMRDTDKGTLTVQRKEVKNPRTPRRAQSMNQLEASFDRARLSSPRSSGNLKTIETPRRTAHTTQPTTPAAETHSSRPMHMGATQDHSPTHFGHHGGMYHGLGQAYSPTGFVGHPMNANPGMYGGSVSTTPPTFGVGMSPFRPSGPFWPATNAFPLPDHTGGMPFGYPQIYGTSPPYGGPPSVLESPVRAHYGFGYPGTTMGHPGLGHPGVGPQGTGFGYPAGNPGNSGSGFSPTGFGHPVGAFLQQAGGQRHPSSSRAPQETANPENRN